MIRCQLPYDIIYLPDSCEANAITFVLPSNNKLNVEPTIKATEYKLGFNRSHSKINNLSLMQSLNISSLTDNRLKILANKVPEMKHVSIYNIDSTLSKHRTYLHSLWSPMKVKRFSTMVTPIVAISIITLSIGLYLKCFRNGKSCVCKYTRPPSLPINNTHIELEPI